MRRPEKDEYDPYYHGYIELVKGSHLIDGLKYIHTMTHSFLHNIPSDKLEYRYKPDKWNIKEIVTHLIDVERIMSYRSLRFARGDKTELSGFDENEYVARSNAEERSFSDLLNEYLTVRRATIELFTSFSEEMLDLRGMANKAEVSVRALGFIIAGHELHHSNIIKTRYL